jgi:hypothetical protein
MKSLVFKPIWLMLALALISTATNAAELGVLTYEIADGQVAITNCSRSAQGDLVIPGEIEGLPVIGIRGWAFDNCKSLTSINIPDSVISIGRAAFEYCTSLKSINIPDGVTKLEPNVLNGCVSLSSIIIPKSVTSIEESALNNCDSQQSLTILGSNTDINDSFFRSRVSALESFTIPQAFHSRLEARRLGPVLYEIYPWGWHVPSAVVGPTLLAPSVRMAPVIMVQGLEGSVKTIEVASTPDGPWRFWMTVSATESGVAITDLDGQASKRFYRVVD